jgi:hypothetical protein
MPKNEDYLFAAIASWHKLWENVQEKKQLSDEAYDKVKELGTSAPFAEIASARDELYDAMSKLAVESELEEKAKEHHAEVLRQFWKDNAKVRKLKEGLAAYIDSNDASLITSRAKEIVRRIHDTRLLESLQISYHEDGSLMLLWDNSTIHLEIELRPDLVLGEVFRWNRTEGEIENLCLPDEELTTQFVQWFLKEQDGDI